MSIFGAYAHFYDALYQDKDYNAECDFLAAIFARYAPGPIRTILDLGCGTGGHALLLAQRGYQVTGVDRSEEMLAIAQAKATSTFQRSNVPTFQRGDIRTLALGQTFDAVICMFAVMSYMTTNADVGAALTTARRHLAPGGLLIFDGWHGPAVLTERPSDRYKIIQTGDERTIRFVQPALDVVRHTVDVSYKVMRIRRDRIVEEVDEVHPMRFFFAQELALHLECAGFRLLQLCPFLELDGEVGERVWNVTVVAEAT
jgi:SAM-dependent methyltransferase